MRYYVSNIEWDTDGTPIEELDLPLEVVVDVDDDEEIADRLSDEYGFCVKAFRFNAEKHENVKRFAIVPVTQLPVDIIEAEDADDAMGWFAARMDGDMNMYFKAVPEETIHTSAELPKSSWMEAVVTAYSYDSPVVSFFKSQDAAIQYIKDSMYKELENDRENGYDGSILEYIEDELFGMRLTTRRRDGTTDVMSMVLAQSVWSGDEESHAEDKLPQMALWKKQCLNLSYDEFNDIVAKIYGYDVKAEFCMDGIWLSSDSGRETPDIDDDQFNEDLSEYFGVCVKSVHIDDLEPPTAWIVYQEAAANG